MDNKLVVESLKDENSFSSNTHGIDTVSKDVNTDGLKDYPIPSRYNKTKLVLLPVNKTRYYFYWEFAEDFIHEQKIDLNDVSFHIIDEKHKLIENIKCQNNYGQYFFELKHPCKNIQIVARYKHGIQLKRLLESNIVKIFNTEIKLSDEDVYINIKKGFTEVIRASMQHFTLGMSSKNYVDEIERLKEFNKISQEHFSSYSLGEK